MSPFNRFVRLLPPFPPVGAVAAPLTGSPAVPHLHRYYEVVRLLKHPSVPPPVDPWVHVPPEIRGFLLVWEEMSELSWVPGQSLGKHALG